MCSLSEPHVWLGLGILTVIFLLIEVEAWSLMSKPEVSCPFQNGDRVFCHLLSHTEKGEVVDVWEVRPGAWLVMVDHGDMEFAYAPNELSLIPQEKDDKVIFVNFHTKQRR